MTFTQFWRINAVTIAVLVAIVSLTPDPEDLRPAQDLFSWLADFFLGDPTSADKVTHFLAYGALGFFSTLGFTRTIKRAGLILPILIGYGLALELLQAMGGARQGDVYDLLANTLGGFLGIAGAVVISAAWPHLPLPQRSRMF